ncbi:hypothetical protein X759_24020 [Mesorhizobium sp. LSHC420B00]|nr:hypothetical protein X759_24020 [Mesorhizobium sp. LSHC420B00]
MDRDSEHVVHVPAGPITHEGNLSLPRMPAALCSSPMAALDEVADLASRWFLRHLISDRSASTS